MASLRDIQIKIGAVKKTKQITKAMNMVASAKLRNAQQRIERFRPYADKYTDVLSELASRVDSGAHPLLEKREEIRSSGIILVTSDKGLCGSFNVNLCQTALKLARQKQEQGREVKFVCVGKKGRDFIRKQGFEILESHADVMNVFDFQLANEAGTMIINNYLAAELDEVHIVYGQFESLVKLTPQSSQILPVEEGRDETAQEESGSASQFIFEPSVEGLLGELLTRHVKVQINRVKLESHAG